MLTTSYPRGELNLDTGTSTGPTSHLKSRHTKTLSKVSDKILRMENHLNDFTQNHDQDLASVINKKWEEHRQTSFSQDPAKVSTTNEPSFTATNDHLNQQIDVVDQDLSNGNINENKSEHVETSTTGNYIRLDNDVVEKLSEIVESFREQSGTSLNGSGDGEKVKRFYFYFCPELKFSL